MKGQNLYIKIWVQPPGTFRRITATVFPRSPTTGPNSSCVKNGKLLDNALTGLSQCPNRQVLRLGHLTHLGAVYPQLLQEIKKAPRASML
jgi:hypothetical protein